MELYGSIPIPVAGECKNDVISLYVQRPLLTTGKSLQGGRNMPESIS